MEDKNKFIIGISMIACLLIGGMLGRSSPITTTSTNDVTIKQQVPENSKNLEIFEKNSKNLKKNEKFSKKININTATLGEFIDARVGIGETKFKKLEKNRPYSDPRELLDKGIIGYYAYNKHKDRFVVGD